MITDTDELRTLYVDQRMPVRRIAARYGCGLNAVYTALARADIPLRSKVPDPMTEAVTQWYRIGLSIGATAAELGIAYRRVEKIVHLAGITRPSGRIPATPSPAAPTHVKRIGLLATVLTILNDQMHAVVAQVRANSERGRYG